MKGYIHQLALQVIHFTLEILRAASAKGNCFTGAFYFTDGKMWLITTLLEVMALLASVFQNQLIALEPVGWNVGVSRSTINRRKTCAN